MTIDTHNFLSKKFGYNYEDLYDPFRLKALTEDFYNYFESKDKNKFDSFIKYRDSKGEGFSDIQISNILIDGSYILNDFVIELFQLENEQEKFIKEVEYEKEILELKNILQKKVFKKFKTKNPSEFDWYELDGFASKLKQLVFPDYDFKNDEEKITSKFILEIIEIEKNYRWFYEEDKFAPVNFVIQEEIKSKAERILSGVKSSGIIRTEVPEDSDLSTLRFILNKLEKWIYAKKYFDPNAAGWTIYFEPHKLDFSRLVEFENPDADLPELLQARLKDIARDSDLSSPTNE